MYTKGKDIDGTNGVARTSGPTLSALVYPTVLAPPPAYGTRLRAVRFIKDDGTHRLVSKLVDELACAGSAHLLGLHSPGALGGVVERFPDIACGTWECLSYLTRCLVAQIADAPPGSIQQLVFAALQSLVAARSLFLARLQLLDARELLVAVLDGRLGRAPTYEDDFLSISGGDEGIHPQVHANHRLLRALLVGDLTDEAHHAIGQPDYHEASRDCHGAGETDAHCPTLSVRQDEAPVTNASVLVGVDHIAIVMQTPRITRFCLSILAQLSTRLHGFAELADDLLG